MGGMFVLTRARLMCRCALLRALLAHTRSCYCGQIRGWFYKYRNLYFYRQMTQQQLLLGSISRALSVGVLCCIWLWNFHSVYGMLREVYLNRIASIVNRLPVDRR